MYMQDFLSYARAFWVTKALIAWNISDDETSVSFYASRKANLHFSDNGIQGVKHDLSPKFLYILSYCRLL